MDEEKQKIAERIKKFGEPDQNDLLQKRKEKFGPSNAEVKIGANFYSENFAFLI
jgi:hypothetical protein